MPCKALLLLWPLLASLALPGCMHCQSPATSPAKPEEVETGYVVPRTPIVPETDVGAASTVARSDERTLWGMGAHDTQCRAAAKSGTADMMQKESEALDSKNCLTRNSKSTRMKQTLLRHASVEARNVAAGTALELFYRLAELEAKADLLRDNLVLAGQTMAELQKLSSQGLKAPPEFAQLQKQQLEMAGDQARAELGIQQINGELGRLLNWHSLGLQGYLWPVESFDMVQTTDEPEAAVAVGMKQRAQLTMIRAARDDVDAKTLPTMLLLLRSYSGFLGMSRAESFVSFMGAGVAPGGRKEMDKRQQQMDEMLQEQEYVVAQEIRQAIHTIQSKATLVALAKEKNKIAREKLKDVEEKRQRGIASVVEVSAQRFVLAQAQAELIQEVMAWHTARAKLKQAQGLLAAECGFTPEHPWTADCKSCDQTPPPRIGAFLGELEIPDEPN